VRAGAADIVWAVPANTPGRFPVLETFELPFVASPRARATSLALQEFAERHLRDEFGDVHPVCFWAHDRGILHVKRKVDALEDLKGLRIRVATRLAGAALQQLGAKTVAVPVPLVPRALVQQAIDGCALPWEVVPALKLHGLVKFHTEVPGSPTLSTTTFVLAMNKARYAALPGDLKRVIDDNSGPFAAAMAGTLWDEQAVRVEELVRGRGNTVAVLAAAEAERWRKATEPVVADWLKAMKEHGHDGGQVLAAARGLVARHERA
jgi:TRAP-type C4-dicarboxylate transport system substrate-binding protein